MCILYVSGNTAPHENIISWMITDWYRCGRTLMLSCQRCLMCVCVSPWSAGGEHESHSEWFGEAGLSAGLLQACFCCSLTDAAADWLAGLQWRCHCWKDSGLHTAAGDHWTGVIRWPQRVWFKCLFSPRKKTWTLTRTCRDTGGCSGSPGLSLGDSWLLDETSSRPLPGSLLTLSSTVSALSLTWRERGGYGERDRGRRERSTVFSGERTEQTTEVELFPLEGQIRRAGESVLPVTVTVLVIFFSDIF